MKRLNLAVLVASVVSMLLCSCGLKNNPPAAARAEKNAKTNQVARFKTNEVAKSAESASEAALIKSIKLQGIGGTETRPFAIINGRTLEEGEAGRVKTAKTNVLLRCVAISNASVVVTIEGLKGERKLYLN
jgi:hypothetical protein